MFCLGKFVIYISCEWVTLLLHLCYKHVYINMPVNIIFVSALTCFFTHSIYSLVVLHLENFVLYLLCSWFILPLNFWSICIYIILFVHIISMFTSICFVLYRTYSFVEIQLGKPVVYITLYISPLFSPMLTCIQNSGLTPFCFNLLFSCRVHWHTHICS